MKKLLCLVAAALMFGGLAGLPAAAQTTNAPATTPAPAKAAPAKKATHAKHATHTKRMPHRKSAHKTSCYDYAWESQQMKDCLAKKG